MITQFVLATEREGVRARARERERERERESESERVRALHDYLVLYIDQYIKMSAF